MLVLRWFQIVVQLILLLSGSILGIYFLIASPLLYVAYSRLPPAGSNSVYIPGAGFSGFWYHLGFLQGSDVLEADKQFYCYSSGCLSLVLAFLNTSLIEAYDISYQIQKSWKNGTIGRYEMVNMFVDQLIVRAEKIETSNTTHDFLHRIHILVTTDKDGVTVQHANTLLDLKDLLVQTTWIPYVTGNGMMLSRDNSYFLDGGFSRRLHPSCSISLPVPITWKTTWHTLDPSFDEETALIFWNMGLSKSQHTIPNIVKHGTIE